jgi:hypothetical protein
MEQELEQNLVILAARAFARAVGILEGFLCMICCTGFFLMGGFGSVIAVANCVYEWKKTNIWLVLATVVGTVGWLCLDLPYSIRLMLMAIRHEHPVALKCTLHQAMPPKILRPLVALWWLAHFSVAAWLAALFHSFNRGQSTAQMLSLIPAIAVGFSANGFLMLSVCSATTSAKTRITIWRFRIIIDVIIALFGAFVISRIIPK